MMKKPIEDDDWFSMMIIADDHCHQSHFCSGCNDYDVMIHSGNYDALMKPLGKHLERSPPTWLIVVRSG